MKILASDFDGTLFYNGGISDSDRKAINDFRKNGNKFGIVSGRDIDNGLIISRTKLIIPDFTICCTGAIIMDGNGKIIYTKKGKSGDFFYKIIDKAMSLDADLFMISDGLIKYNVDVWGKNTTDFTNLKEYTQANTWFKREEDARIFAQYVNENFHGLVSAHQNGLGVDMPPPDTSKVTGIYKCKELFNADKVYTCGDNVNDIEMIKEFNGFAVSNAVKKVKEVANRHCDRICDMIYEIMDE